MREHARAEAPPPPGFPPETLPEPDFQESGMTTRTTRTLAAVCATVALCATTAAAADPLPLPPPPPPPPQPQAQPAAANSERAHALDLYQAAMSDYAGGNHGSALEKLDDAAKLSPAPVITLARAYDLDKLGRLRDAARLYVMYMLQRPDDPDKVSLRRRVVWIARHLAATTPAPTADEDPVAADEAPVGTDPVDPAPLGELPPAARPGHSTLSGRTVRVSFVGRGSDPVPVTDIATGAHCSTPCSLQFSPGSHDIKVGKRQRKISIDVPPGGANFTVANRTTALMVSGIVITSVGGLVEVLGAGYAIAAASSSDPAKQDAKSTGFQVMLGGTLVAIAGVIMLEVSDRGWPKRVGTAKPRHRVARLQPFIAPVKHGGVLGVAARF